MDFSMTEEQRLLKESVDRLIADKYTFDERMKIAGSADGYSEQMWTTFAELGLLAVPFPEELGGLGGGGVDLMIVMEAFGRGLVVEPYLATVVLGGGLVEALGSEEQKAEILEAVIGGARKLAFAHGEPDSRFELAQVRTTATKSGDGWVLDGRKSVVLNGAQADDLIVSARVSGDLTDEDGIALFLVPKDTEGLTLRGSPSIDGGQAAEVELTGVRLGAGAELGAPGQAYPAIEQVTARGIAALCAEAVGAIEATNDITLDYLKTRKQFGKPIGSFQALQHRMVDMRVALEEARSMSVLAAAKLRADRAERERSVSAAKSLIGRAARHVAEESIQMHGGIAMTWEYSVGHYCKRLVMIDHQLGDVDHHEERFVRFVDGT